MIEDQVRSIVINTLRIEDSVYDEDLTAGDIPEWDSLAHANLLMATEKHFSITFDVTDTIDIETVGDLIAAVRNYTSATA